MARVRFMTPDEERRAVGRVKALQADKTRTADYLAARNDLINRSMPLVYSVIRQKFSVEIALGRGVDRAQDGAIGLLEAVDQYDPAKGMLSFRVFAKFLIRNRIIDAIRDEPVVRSPHYYGTADPHAAQREAARTSSSGGRYKLLAAVPVRDETADAVDAHLDAARAALAVDGLTPRERQVIRLRFGLDGSEPLLAREVGTVIGLTKQRVYQIEAKALETLRTTLNASEAA